MEHKEESNGISLPNEIYVQWYDEGAARDENWLSVDETKIGAADNDGGGKRVGVYKLVKVVSLTKTVRTTVAEKKAK